MGKGNAANFGGKKAAPFGSRKSTATDRKKASTKTAKGTKKLGVKDVFGLTTDATGPSKSGYKPMNPKGTKTIVGKDGKRRPVK